MYTISSYVSMTILQIYNCSRFSIFVILHKMLHDRQSSFFFVRCIYNCDACSRCCVFHDDSSEKEKKKKRITRGLEINWGWIINGAGLRNVWGARYLGLKRIRRNCGCGLFSRISSFFFFSSLFQSFPFVGVVIKTKWKELQKGIQDRGHVSSEKRHRL